MRVAINAVAIEPRRPGGDATYVLELVRHLSAVAPEWECVVFVARSARPLFPEPSANRRYIVCPVPEGSLVARALWEQIVLPDWIRRVRPDVLHAPVNVAPLWSRVPTVLTVHEVEPFGPGTGIPSPLLWWWRVVRSQSARRAVQIVTVSNAARRAVLRVLPVRPDRVSVVPLGVDHARFAARDAAPGSSSSAASILWVGRPYPRKQVPTLIAAFAELRQRGLAKRLSLVGPRGWDEAAVSAAIRTYDCADAVDRLAPTWGDDLVELYQQANVLAFPSADETFGLPMLEAQACGTPVVAGDIPALREVGGDGAVFVSPGIVSALAHGLADVLSITELRQRLRAEGQRNAGRFSWSRTASGTANVYGQALSSSIEASEGSSCS
jgi:glycosyltransferase involved in cell wall biosynthesis